MFIYFLSSPWCYCRDHTTSFHSHSILTAVPFASVKEISWVKTVTVENILKLNVTQVNMTASIINHILVRFFMMQSHSVFNFIFFKFLLTGTKYFKRLSLLRHLQCLFPFHWSFSCVIFFSRLRQTANTSPLVEMVSLMRLTAHCVHITEGMYPNTSQTTLNYGLRPDYSHVS